MSIEDRLRSALRARAAGVRPDDEAGWAGVEQGLAHARNRRRRVAAAVVVTAAAALVAAVLAPAVLDDGHDSFEVGVTDDQISTSTTDPPPSSTTSTTAAPTTTTTLWPPDQPWPGIWPYSTPGSLVAAANDPSSELLGPEATAAEFGRQYLGMRDPEAGDYQEGGPDDGEVVVRPWPGSPLTTVVSLRSFTVDGREGWVVTAAHSPDIVLDTPEPHTELPSGGTVRVTGQARAYEGTVMVEVRDDGMEAGEHLGQTFVTASGSAEPGPYEGEVEYRPPAGRAGALVLYSSSADDGFVDQATVIRIFFS